METLNQDFQFLDLTGIDEEERNHLHSVLYSIGPNLELPWETNVGYNYSSEFSDTRQYGSEMINGPVGLGSLVDNNLGPNTQPLQHTCDQISHHSQPVPPPQYHESPVSPVAVPPQSAVAQSAATSTVPSPAGMLTLLHPMVPPLHKIFVNNWTANLNVGLGYTPQLCQPSPEATPRNGGSVPRRQKTLKCGVKRQDAQYRDTLAEAPHGTGASPGLEIYMQPYYAQHIAPVSYCIPHFEYVSHHQFPQTPVYNSPISTAVPISEAVPYSPAEHVPYTAETVTEVSNVGSHQKESMKSQETEPENHLYDSSYTTKGDDVDESEIVVQKAVNYHESVEETVQPFKQQENCKLECVNSSSNVTNSISRTKDVSLQSCIDNSSKGSSKSELSAECIEHTCQNPALNEQLAPECDTVSASTGQASTVPNRTNSFSQHSAQSTLINSNKISPVPSDKSYASLFYKEPHKSSVQTNNSKPLAKVGPFQNEAHIGETGIKLAEEQFLSHSPIVNNKNFPHLKSSVENHQLEDMGEYLENYQLDHRVVLLQPRGLTNRGNWCYINSTLQALLACPPFYNLMKSLPAPIHRNASSSTPIVDSIVKFVNEFQPLPAQSRIGRKEKALRKDDASIDVQTGNAFEPIYIYKMLSSIHSNTFKVEGLQEDAEEFLSCLLNALHDEMQQLMKLYQNKELVLTNGDITTNGEQHQNQDEDETAWKEIGPKNRGSITRRADFGRSPVSDIFRGQLRTKVQRAGDESTDNIQPFFTLQLDIEKAQSVKDALELLVGKDPVEGITCSRTKQQIEAWKQSTLEQLPFVLVLHLKWFDYIDGCSKIVKTIDFPIDLKVDTKLITSHKRFDPKQREYKLFAVVYHDGKEATKGHYVTDVFHVGYGSWVRYDDSTVTAVQESEMLHPRAPRVPYLLYYRRCDTISSLTVNKTR